MSNQNSQENILQYLQSKGSDASISLNKSKDSIYQQNFQFSRIQQQLRNELLMNSLDKYQKFDKFPIKLLLCVILIISTTMQVIYSTTQVNQTSQY